MYNYDKELELFSQEIECKTLGALIFNNDFYDLIDFLKPEYFYFKDNSLIYKFISEKLKNNEKIDFLLLKDFFECEIENLYKDIYTAEELVKLEEFKKKKDKGLNYLRKLQLNSVCIFEEIKDYALKIKDYYKKRNLKDFLELSLLEIAKSKTSEHIINNLNLKVDMLEDKTDYNYNMISAKDIAKTKIERLKISYETKEETNKNIIKSGFMDFDRAHDGFTKKDLVILAGRPSIGKSTLALQIAMNISEKGYNTIFFSIEMSKEQLISKILSNKSEIKNRIIRQNKILYSSQIDKINDSISYLSKSLYLNDSSFLNCNLIQKSLKRFVRKNKKVDLIVIDYLQLLKPNENKKNLNKVYEIGEITKQLKQIAKDFNCVVLCLSQLSRAIEDRPNKRPIMRDLRDSGNIEEDADVVLMCYREHYYQSRKLPLYEERRNKKIITDAEFNKFKTNLDYIRYDCELIVGKNRNGETGMTRIHFKPEYSKFTDACSINYYKSN